VAIKVIVELRAKPGRRAELMSLLERVAELGPSQRGFLGSRRYEVLDNPDMLIEIAEWESAGARVAHMEESAATGAYAPPAGDACRAIQSDGHQAAASTIERSPVLTG
jgi:quinol monooxygenase YgiN